MRQQVAAMPEEFLTRTDTEGRSTRENKRAYFFTPPPFALRVVDNGSLPINKNIETPKLLLRRLVPNDAEWYHALVTDPNVKSFATSQASVASVEKYRRWFGNAEHQRKDLFAVISKDSDCPIGICGFCDDDKFLKELFPEMDLAEITIQLFEPYRRCGFGTELVAILSHRALEKQKRMIAIPNPKNRESIAFLSAISIPAWLCINDQGNHGHYQFTVYAQNHD